MKSFLNKLKELNITLQVSDDDLKVRGSETALTEDILQGLRENKKELIEYVRSVNNKKKPARIPKRAMSDDYELSAAQKKIYFSYVLDPGSLVYNLPLFVRIEGRIDKDKIEECIHRLIDRHESLRTEFILTDRGPRQRILEQADLTLGYDYADPSDLTGIIRDFMRPFDLSRAPLIRARLILTGKGMTFLLVDMHHIISDGISQSIIVDDFKSFYRGQAPDPQEIQYADFSEWRKSEDQQQSLSGQREWWINEFAEKAPVLHIPMDFERPARMTNAGAVFDFFLEEQMTRRLNELALSNGCSLFMVLITIYAVLLAKLSGEEDIVIGFPISGRNYPGLDHSVGMFVNILPLRNRLPGGAAFHEILEEVKQKSLQAFGNQDYPFDTLVEELKLDRIINRSPLFDFAFVLQNMAGKEDQLEGIGFYEPGLGLQTSKFDLTLRSREAGGQLNLSFEYSTLLFGAGTIRTMSSWYERIVAQILHHPAIKMADISLLNAEERSCLLTINDNTAIAYPDQSTLVELFERQAAENTDRIAVEYEDRSVTYGELNKMANRLARSLRQRGVVPDAVIGLFLERSVDMIAAILGVLKAGGAYLPIDIDSPPDRIAYILDNSQSAFVLTSKGQAARIPAERSFILLEEIGQQETDDRDPAPVNKPSDLCYVIYTSGTTGNPKGVMVEHKNVVRLLFNDSPSFRFTANDTWTLFHNYCFDFSVWEMYGALLFGGKLVIVPKMTAMDPGKFRTLLQEKNVTILNQTPTSFYNLIQEDQKKNIGLSGLRLVIFGGEALNPGKLAKWKDKYPGVLLVNMYGITETTVHVTYKEIGHPEITQNISNIGRPISTLGAYVLDRYLRPVPPGVTGELFISGEGLSRGYLHNQELTNTKFIQNPYKAGSRLYRTGDLAKLRDNGELVYLGRTDQQVQLKGFRIEPGEIESRLVQFPLIDSAAVILRERGAGEKYLCAYFCSTATIDPEKLRSFLSEKLPFYMVPAHFVQIGHMPLTVNNKLDTDRLPVPGRETGNDFIGPFNSEAEKACLIWTNALGIKEVGVRDNFFSLGGDSILAIRVINEMNATLHRTWSIADLYERQTIEDLVRQVPSSSEMEQDGKRKAAEELAAFQTRIKRQRAGRPDIQEVYPMSGIEKGMVYHSLQKSPTGDNVDHVLYHEQNIYPITLGQFSYPLFLRALSLMIDKHEELRKVYDLNTFTHIVYATMEPSVHFDDISALDRAAQEKYILEIMLSGQLRGTILSFSFLWRMRVLKLRDDLHYLLFDMHHSLLDGWSLASFLTEFHNLYLRLSEDSAYVPERLACTYKDHILREIEEVGKAENIRYWTEELKGYERLKLPKTNDPHVYRARYFDLGSALRSRLEEKASAYGSNLKHLCFAAYLYTMRMLSYSSDLTVGIVTNNRPLVRDGEKLLGCFLNTIPVRVKIPDNISWRTFIGLTDRKLKVLKAHEGIPFVEILNITGERSDEANPVFDTAFNFIDFHIYDELLTEEGRPEKKEEFRFDPFMNSNTLCDFHIDCQKGFELKIKYSAAMVSESLALSLHKYYTSVLMKFTDSENELIGNEHILPPEELNQLLEQLNDTRTAYPDKETVISLFERQAEETPDNTAVLFGDSSLSYRDLKNTADQVARYLTGVKKLKKGDLVGVLLEREAFLIPMIYGILKAGCVYVPIDPVYPAARINAILENSSLSLLVTRHRYYSGGIAAIALLDLDQEQQLFRSEPFNVPYGQTGGNEPYEPVGGGDAAYIIYTSGSTGKPQGVIIEHHSLVNRLSWMQRSYPIQTGDVLLQKTPLVFDVSIWELFWWSSTGAALCLLKPGEEKDPKAIISAIARYRVTTIHFVPSMLRVFLAGIRNGFDYRTLSGLRQVFASGEALKPEHNLAFDKTLRLHNASRLINLYGPTEATVDVSYYDCPQHEVPQNLPIGKPIDNTRLLVLNDYHQLLPAGIPGELCIAGAGLARGYLNNIPLTQTRFIDSLCLPGNERIYKTGDLARWLPDGNMDFLGRLDYQVKIRGFRIETGEIETVLCSHELITGAAVLAKEGQEDKYLAGYYVSGRPIGVEELRRFIAERLPEYMIPAYFIWMEKLPLTHNGKLDREALPDAEFKEDDDCIAASDETELRLSKIWSDILHIDPGSISVTRNFFELGGNSLKTLMMIDRVQEELQFELSLTEFFRRSSIRGLGEYINSAKAEMTTGR